MSFPSSQIHNPASSGGSAVTEEVAWRGQWGYRILRSSANELGLETVGPNSVAAGVLVPPDIATLWDISTQEAMDATGAATGATVASSLSTVFAVYWCTLGDFAGGLGFSTTAPTKVDGIYLLGAAGDALGCRFVGWIRTSAAGALVDTVQDRHVVNYFNRRPTRLEIVPNYSNNNAPTTYARSSASWTTVAASAAASQASYISNGEDCGYWGCTGTIVTGDAAGSVHFGIGKTTTTPLVTASIVNLVATFPSCSCQLAEIGSFGALNTLNFLVRMDSIVPGWAIVADSARNGAAADPPATFMHGWVMA